jgi:lysophospholipase L1-like esterase
MEQKSSYETFEIGATFPLETYEWDDIWFDHATDTKQKRVIVFGDSITVNYRFPLVENLRGEFCVDNYGTSKAADNPFLKENMRLILAQQNHSIIYFCSGHGTHQTAEDYERNVEKLVKWMVEAYPEKTLIISSRIYTAYEPKLDNTLQRNASLKRIAEKYGLLYDDIYTITEGRRDLLKENKVHLNEEGQKVVAAKVAQTIRSITLK